MRMFLSHALLLSLLAGCAMGWYFEKRGRAAEVGRLEKEVDDWKRSHLALDMILHENDKVFVRICENRLTLSEFRELTKGLIFARPHKIIYKGKVEETCFDEMGLTRDKRIYVHTPGWQDPVVLFDEIHWKAEPEESK